MILNFIKKSIVQGIFIVLPLLFLLWMFKAVLGICAELLEPFSKQLFFLSKGAPYEDILRLRIVKFFVLCLIVGIAYQLLSKLSFVQKADAYIVRKLPVYNYIKNVLFRFTNKEILPFKEVVYIKMNRVWHKLVGIIFVAKVRPVTFWKSDRSLLLKTSKSY